MSKGPATNPLRHCIIVGEPLLKGFSVLNPFLDLLQPAGPFEVLLHWLQKSRIEEATIFCSDSKPYYEKLRQKFFDKAKSDGKQSAMRINIAFMKKSQLTRQFLKKKQMFIVHFTQEFQQLCIHQRSVLREVHFRSIVSQDFLLLHADSVLNIDLNHAYEIHATNRLKLENVVMTYFLEPLSYLTSQTYIIHSNTKEILHLHATSSDLSLDTSKVNLRKQPISIYTTLRPAKVYICTTQLLNGFHESFELNTIDDFVMGMLSSDVYEQKIMGHILEPGEWTLGGGSPLMLYLCAMAWIGSCWGNQISATLNSYQHKTAQIKKDIKIQLTGLVRRPFNIIQPSNYEIPAGTTVSHNCLLGAGINVGSNCTIYKTIIGENCEIGEGAVLRWCVVLPGCKVPPHKRYQRCLLEPLSDSYSIVVHSFGTQWRTEWEGRARNPEEGENSQKKSHIAKIRNHQQAPPGVQNLHQFHNSPLYLASQESRSSVAFEEELIRTLEQEPSSQQLFRLQKFAQKDAKFMTKSIIRQLSPEKLAGVTSVISTWGQALLQLHSNDEVTFLKSLEITCREIEKYNKALHVFIQVCYGQELATQESILKWWERKPSQQGQQNRQDAKNDQIIQQMRKLCEPFIAKVQQSLEEIEDQEEEQTEEQ